MISLKRLIEGQSESLLSAALESLRSAIMAMARAAAIAYPATAPEFQSRLVGLSEQFTRSASPETIANTGRQVVAALDNWSLQVGESYQQSALEIKQILETVADLAQSVGDRDSRYGKEFIGISDAIQQIAGLEDLQEIRVSLSKNSAALKSCLARMENDSNESVARMRQQVADYQARLETAEIEVFTDGLTRLYNRRGAERHLNHLARERKPFCIAILDLNQFKVVNDSYGHQTGDELLKQFSVELRANAAAGEVVARWGGDEFLLVLETKLSEARLRTNFILDMALGEYTIAGGRGPIRLRLDSAAGTAEWDGAEDIGRLIERADASMYANKATSKQAAKSR